MQLHIAAAVASQAVASGKQRRLQLAVIVETGDHVDVRLQRTGCVVQGGTSGLASKVVNRQLHCVVVSARAWPTRERMLVSAVL